MKVSFVVPDLFAPITGIAARMAKYLEGMCETEIVGTCLWGQVNPMYAHAAQYKRVEAPRIYRVPEYFRETTKLSRALTGDVIVAMKAFAPSLPAALQAKRERGAKVIAYLDEWDGAVAAGWSFAERMRHWRRDWMHPCESLYCSHFERRLCECDVVLGTTKFLAEQFRGRVYPIGVDTDFWRPQPETEVAELKQSLGLAGKRLVVFGGVVRPHKGVEVFAEALATLPGDDVRLVVLGPMNEHVAEMMANPEYGRLVVCPATDRETTEAIHRQMPLYLAMGDVLAVPLADTPLARSQMPCKVFEAMAMGKPIVANAVSDLPDVLDGCGWTVPPGDPAAVAAALREIADNPAEAARRAAAARERAISQYDAASAASRLRSLLHGLLPPSPGKDSP